MEFNLVAINYPILACRVGFLNSHQQDSVSNASPGQVAIEIQWVSQVELLHRRLRTLVPNAPEISCCDHF